MTAEPTITPTTVVWRQLHWPQPLDAAQALAVLRSWATDQHSPELVLEVRSSGGQVDYLLGAPLPVLLAACRRLRNAVPVVRITGALRERTPVMSARRLKLSTRHRPLRADAPEALARGVLGALLHAGKDETLVLQLILGPRRIPLAVPNHSPSSVVMPWYQVAWLGNGGQVDGEKRAALRAKVSDHGFAATIRLGVHAATPVRRRDLLVGLFSAMRLTEAPGVKLGLARDSVRKTNAAKAPWWYWPLRLNASELLALTAWPVGDESLPGQPALHPKLLAPTAGSTGNERVVAVATAPGVDAKLVLPVRAALHHLHVLGPTGTGKSTLLIQLIGQDVQAGRAVVVVDPQGDLVTDVLRRVPAHRHDDVIVLDPADAGAPVGLDRPGKSGGRYVCELSLILPDSSAL
jgi:hypothetical protein